MIAMLLVAVWGLQSTEPFIDGMATYYGPGVMEEVVFNRNMDLRGYIGGVALNRAEDLGRVVWLERGSEITGPWLVVDCAQAGEHYLNRENADPPLVVEVPWEQAEKWQMRGPTQVRVWFIRPAVKRPPVAM